MQIKNFYLGSLTSLAIMASTLVHAAEQFVHVPTFEGGLSLSFGTWLATSSADNEAYGAEPTDSGFSILNVDPDYDFGALATFGYIMPDTANSIELAFRSFDTSDDSSGNGAGEPDDPDETGHLYSSIDYNFNSLDLMIGQFIDLGQVMQLRFSGGLSYVELEQTIKNSFEEEDLSLDHYLQKNKYTGWGPRLGIDGRYDFGQGFGIVGGGSVAYYLGDLDVNVNQTGDDEVGTLTNDLDSHAVTNLRGNLGIDYVYFFDNEEQTTLGLELGYQVDYYADVVSNTGMIGNTDIDNVAVTFSGPYLNIKAIL